MIDIMLLGGSSNEQTDRQTDICSSGVAFATENIIQP